LLDSPETVLKHANFILFRAGAGASKRAQRLDCVCFSTASRGFYNGATGDQSSRIFLSYRPRKSFRFTNRGENIVKIRPALSRSWRKVSSLTGFSLAVSSAVKFLEKLIIIEIELWQ